jgi:serine/threonine protein kinase
MPRTGKGPVSLNEAFTLAGQILDALDAAHCKGITHRDLKPGNILVSKAGVKVLDFGLAKIEHAKPERTLNETATTPLTSEGTVLGTLQYMSPEQIEGQEADARSDIFAFGLVLYELITGKRAFEGKTKTSLVASILKDQPRPLSELQPLSPPALERVVRTCLEKDPNKRWQSAREVKHVLEWISAGPSFPRASATATATAGRRWLWPSIAAVLAVIAVVATWAPWRAEPPAAEPVRFQIPLPEKTNAQGPEDLNYAVSPDGRRLDGSTPSVPIQQFRRSQPAHPPPLCRVEWRFLLFSAEFDTGARLFGDRSGGRTAALHFVDVLAVTLVWQAS